ncbi:MAG: radical SAM protein [Oscillochloridaceae bacterium]|nr:radical SAM protein [Chloroflexaceae bacterium]MDW8391733.1 radical SAM protein [Oscillochloridaceae bacterium]
MNLDAKLDLLTDAARYDLCSSSAGPGWRFAPRTAAGDPLDDGLSRQARPLFRVLMSSVCAWNCTYCPLRAASDVPRASLEPEELAAAFLPRYRAGAVQGLFVTTAVHGDVSAAIGRLLDGVEALRVQHAYDGYVHVKLLPGASFSDVERASRLANRLSLNLEAPSAEHLRRISPERLWHTDVIERLRWARERQRAGALPAGTATQFVVGVAGERDRELLETGAWLYRELGLRRVYFGTFRPIAGTPLAEAPPTPLLRVRRLQQADWMLRGYGFSQSELPFNAAGDLPLHLDPKLAWALANLARFPVELNTADPEQLLRVPGIGPRSVARIVRLRQLHPFRELRHLTSLGAQANRARDFVTLDGRFFGRTPAELARLYAPRPIVEQLSLF